MSDGLDIEGIGEIDIDLKANWTGQQRIWYEQCHQILSRYQKAGKDITGNFGSDWYLVGCVCVLFGDVLGKELFHAFSQLNPEYDEEKTNYKFAECKKSNKLKTIKKLYDICKAHEIDYKYLVTDKSEPLSIRDFNPDLSDEQVNDAKNYGIYVRDYRYWKVNLNRDGNGDVTLQENAISNFCMDVLYMIKSRKHPKRVVKISQINPVTNQLTEEIVEVDTSQISSAGKFDEWVQGIGSYKFHGSKVDYTKLQLKYFKEEKIATIIEVLGYNKDGFFVFNNGIIIDGEFVPASADGIVTHGNKVYYIPSGNSANLHDEMENVNERKFIYKTGSTITFSQWSSLFVEVYGNPGMAGLVYACAATFSDIIFKHCLGFLIPFLYGPGSSGKGSLIKSIMCLYGDPQDPLPLPSRGNTDKGKIRKLAQFRNAIVLLEEYPPNPGDDLPEFIKGIWDRYGSTKAEKDYSFKTTQTPVNSGVMLTGNYYPIHNDALLTRLVIWEVLTTDYTDAQRDRFQELKAQESNGISTVVAELLKYRNEMSGKFAYALSEVTRNIAPILKAANIKEDRMIKNIGSLLATYTVLASHLSFPFTYNMLRDYLIESMKVQQQKRRSGGQVEMFWTVFAYLVKNNRLELGAHFDFDGQELYIQWLQTFSEYAKAYREINNEAAPKNQNIKEELKASEYFLHFKDSYRTKHGTAKTSFLVFDANKLSKAGYDFESIVINKMATEKREGLFKEATEQPKKVHEDKQEVKGKVVDDLPF